MTIPNVAVIGLGCIGGSIVKALANGDVRVRGWSSSPEDCAMTRALGYDVPRTLEETVSGAELAVIAVPVQAIAEIAASVIRTAPESASIFHCGGVQSRTALALDESTYERVRGTHPLAGSQLSGFGAARADLFQNCVVSVERRSTPIQEEQARWLWGQLGAARLDYRTADEHDVLMVWISQLPQLASTALALTFAEAHIDPQSVGPGARDTTRLAGSAFEQWVSLLKAKPVMLDEALVQLETNLSSIRDALRRGDESSLREMWNSARAWRQAEEPPE